MDKMSNIFPVSRDFEGHFEIPEGTEEIPMNAFCGCKKLTSVSIPSSVKKIGMFAFSGCHSLSSIKIPDSVTKLEMQIFRDCRSLKNIDIPESVTSIDSGVFVGCNSLTNIVIPKSVTEIDGNGQFARCTALESIVVEDGNLVYDSRNGCNAIIETDTNTLVCGCKNTIIPNTVSTIGYGAFFCIIGMTNMVIPNSVTRISQFAFYDCVDLTTIVIPQSVTEIGDFAFSNCGVLSVPQLPDTIKVARTAFCGCSSSDNTSDSIESSNDKFCEMDIWRIDNLSIDEYNKFLGSMTEDEREEYLSKSTLNDEPMHPVIDDSTDEDLGVDADELLANLKSKYTILD